MASPIFEGIDWYKIHERELDLVEDKEEWNQDALDIGYHGTGYHYFIHMGGAGEEPPPPPVGDYLLLETGDIILTEDGNFLIQE